MAKNPLTDPAGSIAEGKFPPNTMDAKGTTHKDAQEQSNAEGGNYARGEGKDANDIQPGLKGNQGFSDRPGTA